MVRLKGQLFVFRRIKPERMKNNTGEKKKKITVLDTLQLGQQVRDKCKRQYFDVSVAVFVFAFVCLARYSHFFLPFLHFFLMCAFI